MSSPRTTWAGEGEKEHESAQTYLIPFPRYYFIIILRRSQDFNTDELRRKAMAAVWLSAGGCLITATTLWILIARRFGYPQILVIEVNV